MTAPAPKPMSDERLEELVGWIAGEGDFPGFDCVEELLSSHGYHHARAEAAEAKLKEFAAAFSAAAEAIAPELARE